MIGVLFAEQADNETGEEALRVGSDLDNGSRDSGSEMCNGRPGTDLFNSEESPAKSNAMREFLFHC